MCLCCCTDSFLITWWPWKPVQLDGHLDWLHFDTSRSLKSCTFSCIVHWHGSFRSSGIKMKSKAPWLYVFCHCLPGSKLNHISTSILKFCLTLFGISFPYLTRGHSAQIKRIPRESSAVPTEGHGTTVHRQTTRTGGEERVCNHR